MVNGKRTYNTVQDLCSLVLQQYVWPIALSGVRVEFTNTFVYLVLRRMWRSLCSVNLASISSLETTVAMNLVVV